MTWARSSYMHLNQAIYLLTEVELGRLSPRVDGQAVCGTAAPHHSPTPLLLPPRRLALWPILSANHFCTSRPALARGGKRGCPAEIIQNFHDKWVVTNAISPSPPPHTHSKRPTAWGMHENQLQRCLRHTELDYKLFTSFIEVQFAWSNSMKKGAQKCCIRAVFGSQENQVQCVILFSHDCLSGDDNIVILLWTRTISFLLLVSY